MVYLVGFLLIRVVELEKIELRGTPCPVNFIRCRLALEKLESLEILQVDLDRGEPEEMVLSSLREEGHNVKTILIEQNWIRFIVESNASK